MTLIRPQLLSLARRLTIGDQSQYLNPPLPAKAWLTHRNAEPFCPIRFLESSPCPRVQYGSTSEAGYKRGPTLLQLLSTFQVSLLPRFSDLPCQPYHVENHLSLALSTTALLSPPVVRPICPSSYPCTAADNDWKQPPASTCPLTKGFDCHALRQRKSGATAQ